MIEPAAEPEPEPEPAEPEADAPVEPEADAPVEPEAEAPAEPEAEGPAVLAFIHAWSGQSGSGFFPHVGASGAAAVAASPAGFGAAASDGAAAASGVALADAVADAVADGAALALGVAVGAVALGVVSVVGFLSSHAAVNAATAMVRRAAKERCFLIMVATDASKESVIPRVDEDTGRVDCCQA